MDENLDRSHYEGLEDTCRCVDCDDLRVVTRLAIFEHKWNQEQRAIQQSLNESINRRGEDY